MVQAKNYFTELVAEIAPMTRRTLVRLRTIDALSSKERPIRTGGQPTRRWS
jgi:hypothetical protein